MKQALCLCLLLFAAVASGQQSNAHNVSSDMPDNPKYEKEPVIVVDDSTTPPTLITSWMSFTEDGKQNYVRVAWSQGNVWSPATILGSPAEDSERFLAPKPDGLTRYPNSGDPFLAIGPNNETYLVTVSNNSDFAASDISLWKSIDHGHTWDVESRCSQVNPTSVDKPSIAASNNGNIYVAHLLFKPSAIHVHRRIQNVWDTVTINADDPGSPLVLVVDKDGEDNVYVVWLDRTNNRIFVSYSLDVGPFEDKPRSIGYNLPDQPGTFGTFSRTLSGCRNSDDESKELDATSNLMASYNAEDKSIAIVWHAIETGSWRADMKFTSFSTEANDFVEKEAPTVTIGSADSSLPGNQWTPGIDCDHGRCLVTYYQSNKCSFDSTSNSIKYHPHAILVDAHGKTVGTGEWAITTNDSNPTGYRPSGYTSDTGMGEYQGVYYSAGSWYASFIGVSGTCPNATCPKCTCQGDTYVAKITPPIFSIDLPSPMDGCRPSRTPHYTAYQEARLVLTPGIQGNQDRDISDFAFEWRDRGRLISVEPILYFDVSESTTLKVRVTSKSDGSWDEIPITIEMLTPTATGATKICTACGKRRAVQKPITSNNSVSPGQAVSLFTSAEAGETYTWYRSTATIANEEFATGQTAVDYPTVDTTYQAAADDGVCLMRSEGLRVTVASCVPATISAPEEYTGPASTVAVGNPVNVAVTASGTSLSYAWHLALVTGNGTGAWSAADLGPVVATGPSYTWTPTDTDLNKTYGLYVVVQGGCNEPPLPPRLVKVVAIGACPNATAGVGLNRAVRANGCPAFFVEINPGESVALSPPGGPQGAYSFEWYRSDQSATNANFAHERSVAVSPAADTSYWVSYQYTVDGVIKWERSFNIYILIRAATVPGIHLAPRFQVVPANAGGVIEVVDTAVPDRSFDRYKFEWFQTTNNSTATNVPPLPWSFPRLPLGPLNDDVSFWCRVTDPDGNATTTNVATVAVTCTDGLRGSIHVSPRNYVSRTDRPVVSAQAYGKWLRYDWFERLPEETTPRLYYKHTSEIDSTPTHPLTYYSAKIYDACGQTAVLPETPVYLCVPTIDTQPGDQVVPRGGSADLTVAASPAIAGQPVTYTWWSYDTGQVVGSGPTYRVTPEPGTTKTYYAYVGADCSGNPFSVQTRAVTVTGCALAATVSSDRNITLGQSATLTTSLSGAPVSPADAEYTWYSGTAPGTEYASGVGLWSITTTPQTTTTYWVRVKDGTCTADSNPVSVRICVPVITSQPQGTTIRAGQTASLSVGVAPLNNETLQYQWYAGASGDVTHPVSGATSSTFTTPALTTTTSYWVRVTSSCGAITDSATAVMTVCNNPVISSVTPTRYIRYGDSTWHQVYVTGNNLTYQWYAGSPGNTSVPLKGATQSSISQSPFTTTTYWARVTSYGLCTTDSPTMIIDVCTDPPITTQPASTTIQSGQSTTLTVATSATGATYQWYLGTGTAIQGATSASLTVTPTTDTQYYAQVTRGACTTTSNTATVTACSLAVSLAGGTNIAYGQSTTLTASVSGARAPTNYEWYAGIGANSTLIASGSGLWQKTVTPSVTTQYWVRVSDGICTADSTPVTVRVCVPVITSQPQGTVIRANQTASLSVGVTPMTNETLQYQWYAGTSGDVTHPVSGATSSTFTTPALTTTTLYWMRVTSSCGATTNSVTAVVTVCNNPLISSVTPTRYIRYGGSASHQVSATGNSLTYQWYAGSPGNTNVPLQGATQWSISQSPSTTTTYWARVTSYGLCTTDSPAMVIDVCTDPPITTQPASTTIKSGQSATLTVATSATGATYQWFLGTGTAIQGATSANLTVTPTADTQYYAQVTRGACTTTSNTATVTACSLAVSLAGGTNIAYGQSATLTASESGARAPTNYEWYAGIGANSTLIASGSGLWQKTVIPSVTTQYWVRVSDGICTADSAPVTVSVCKPTITAQPQGKTVNSGQTATLSVTATGAPLSYQWYIGAAGNTAQPIAGATSASYTTTPMSATTSYWVRVTGCTTADSAAATIEVCAPPAITSGPTADSQRIPGTVGKMSVTASGTNLNYQWFTGQSGDTTVPVAGSGCNSSNCSFTLSTSKYYWVRMIGTCGTLNSPVVIHPVSPTIYQQPQSTAVPPGATPTLSLTAGGTDLTYQWYRGATGNTTTPMSGATAATFTVPPVTAPVSYWCRVTSVGNSTAITDSAEAALSFCTGPGAWGVYAYYQSYNTWLLWVDVAEEDRGNVRISWYTGVPGNPSQSVFQFDGSTYIYITATGTQTWWARVWFGDDSCYTDTGGATIRKVQ